MRLRAISTSEGVTSDPNHLDSHLIRELIAARATLRRSSSQLGEDEHETSCDVNCWEWLAILVISIPLMISPLIQDYYALSMVVMFKVVTSISMTSPMIVFAVV